jgi:hypothetical protein
MLSPCIIDMKYLVHPTKLGTAAHILDLGLHGSIDTFCRMYSTGGIGKRSRNKMVICDDSNGRRICHMCRNVYTRNNP